MNATNTARSIDAPAYDVGPTDDDAIIARALSILTNRLNVGDVMSNAQVVRQYLTLKAAAHDGYEVFGVLFLDAQNCVIEFREMFRGTLTQTSVYPREIARAALQLKAASVILTHNHPSGKTDPSVADEALTHAIKSALSVVDVHVLDHFIVTCRDVYSFAENRKL